MKKSEFIWLDGELVEWDNANVSVMTHTLHYGTGVFEGMRARETEKHYRRYSSVLSYL